MPILHRITTDRLIIEECYDVIPEHVEWLNDKGLMRWSEQRWRDHSTNTQEQFLTYAGPGGLGPMVFDIRVDLQSDDNPTIGSLHAHVDKRHKRADMGIMLGPRWHRYGYAKEAWLAVERLLVDVKGIRKFEGGCASGNRPMIKLFQSLGYYGEGTRRRHFDIDGLGYDLYEYGKLVEQIT